MGPRQRRALVGFTLSLALVGLGWAIYDYWTRPSLRVELRDVSGFDRTGGWMPFQFTLDLTNTGRSPVTIHRIHIVPDLDGFNEAYGLADQEDLSPVRLQPGATLTHTARMTLFNAMVLPVRTYSIVFRMSVDTTQGSLAFEFPGEFVHTQTPATRKLTYRKLAP